MNNISNEKRCIMMPFSIITEVTCDLTQQQVNYYGIITLPMTITLSEGNDIVDYSDHRNLSLSKFEEHLRNGALPKTTQVAYTTFYHYFEGELKKGNDILYLGFSSAMSGGYSTAQIVIEELKELYPQHTILSVDSQCACVGQGLFAIKISEARSQGQTLQQCYELAENLKQHIHHFFTIHDLDHLKRGGRISTLSATFGSLLNVKPLLKVFTDGSLKNYGNVRGRSKSIRTICDELLKNIETTHNNLVMIAHMGAETEALQAKQYLLEQSDFKEEDIIINPAGMVIGSHVGLGFVAVISIGKQRVD